jgi:hypothetical protein
MMGRLKVLFFFFFAFSVVIGQNKWDVDLIPDSIRKDAIAVIRFDETKVELSTGIKSTRYYHTVLTLLDEKAIELYFNKSILYDNKLIKLKNIEANIFDSKGNKIDYIKSTNLVDVLADANANELSDNRLKIISFEQKKYQLPYTIEYMYEEQVNFSMFYPSWEPTLGEHVGIESSSFIMSTPKSKTFKYKAKNIKDAVKIVSEKSTDQYIWTLSNQKPIQYDDYSKLDYLPVLLTAPNEAGIDEYFGKSETWRDIGLFEYQLNEGRTELDESSKLKVNELISNVSDTIERIKQLYQYLQKSTRYVSIQLGIGGWQSRSASFTSNKGYGDCKGLSYYMIALLKLAGIKAYPAIIRAGKDATELETDFPSFLFNHMIVAVPLKKDTIWLECTSQINPTGYLGSFTGNRKAIMITPNGGYLVNTKTYSKYDNWESKKVVVFINKENEASATMVTRYKGILSENRLSIKRELENAIYRKILAAELNIQESDIEQFKMENSNGLIPIVDEQIKFKLKKFIDKSQSSIFLAPHFYDFIQGINDVSRRSSDFYLNENRYSYSKTDTIIIQFENKVSLEGMPENCVEKTAFGTYQIKFDFKDQQLLCYRNLEITGGIYPSSESKTWTKFWKLANKKDRSLVALKYD